MTDAQAPLAVIAGTGFYSLDALDDPEPVAIDTAFGPARAIRGRLYGRQTIFLTRHGVDHSVPPHRVNYRANIQALVDLGVSQVLAVNVVGGIGLECGDLSVIEDFIDFTRARPLTFFDGDTPDGVVHTDMTEPYDGHLRGVLIESARALGHDVQVDGVYGAFEGPRFETRAEIRMARSMGVTVVGMTGVPEVVLAKEKGLPYATICLVANPAAGLGPEISVDDVMAVVARGADTVASILSESARRLTQ